jgi:crotonobetainyl-CoA:carnitine CoA-transferase CaiB-like acyl-CoA transferase
VNTTAKVNAPTILGHVRVVDLSQGLAGPLATRLLAEAGAEVVKVEPPFGDVARTLNPTGFASWNRSKRGVLLDVHDVTDRARLHDLLESADVFVHDLSPERAAPLGLDDAALAAAHPKLIVAAVTAFPPGHPDAELEPDELLVQARVGMLDEVDPFRREGPGFVALPVGSLHAAYLLAAGILARLDLLARSGKVGPVRTSLAQGLWANLTMLWNRTDLAAPPVMLGPNLIRGMAWAGFSGRPCADGEYLIAQTMPDLPIVREALTTLDPPGVFGNDDDLSRLLLTRPAATWVELVGEDGGWYEVLRPGECIRWPQSIDAGYCVEVDDPLYGRTQQPGPPFSTNPPCQPTGPAPVLDPSRETGVAWTASGAARGRSSFDRQRFPLEGLKVLDLGMFLAGPFAPQCLADLGADVIKVEPPTGDRMRAQLQLFVGCQRNKRSIGLDLKDPASRPLLERLVRWADVVHHNQRRPPAAELGLDDASLRAIKPDIVFSHTSTYGPAGMRADWPGADPSGMAASGWMWDGNGEGNPPLWLPWGVMDFACALSSLVATMLAVYRHTTTGEGSHVTASLLGAAVASTDRLVCDGSISSRPPVDAAMLGRSPERRLYECRDGWIAVAADRNDSGHALREVAGPSVGADLDAAFVEHDTAEVLAELTAAGVPAAIVATDQRDPFFDDPRLRELGLSVAYPHPEWGNFEQPGAYWGFGDLTVQLRSSPPTLSQHARAILEELGYDDDEVDSFIDNGLVTRPQHLDGELAVAPSD